MMYKSLYSLGWVALAVTLALVLPVQAQTQDPSPTEVATKATTSDDPQAETAREAYDEQDAKPIENWFGCPPADKGAETQSAASAGGQAPGDQTAAADIPEHCDPQAPENESPQKEEQSS